MFAPPTRVEEEDRRVKRPAPPALPQHQLLALQRSAGNAAVTRMLQRKIGFELESGFWSSAVLDGTPTEEHRKTGAVEKTLPTKPPAAREAFYASDRIRGTADELPGGTRDVEFVIEERPESQSDDIGNAFDKVDSLYGQMASELPATTTHDTWLWPEARLAWAPPVKHTWLLDKKDQSETVIQLQATAGVPLEQLANTFARTTQTPTLEATGIHPDAGSIVLAPAQTKADEAVQEFAKAYTGTPGLTDLGALRGMLGLMAQLVIGGTPKPGEEDDEDYSYPKSIAAVLPRTDFATLFTTLPAPLQVALAEKDTKLGYSRFTSLMEMLASRSHKPGLDEPVLGYRAWSQITDTTIVQDVTRRTWADGIVAGQDRLTQVGYGKWLDERAQALGPSVYKERKEESKQLDSIGGWGAKMDKNKDEDLPLVEFRALVDDLGEMFMTVKQAKKVGLKLAAYVDKMVNRTL